MNTDLPNEIDQLVELDHTVEAEMKAKGLQLAHIRWHATRNPDNPERISAVEYAQKVGRGPSVIKNYARDYETFIESRSNDTPVSFDQENLDAEWNDHYRERHPDKYVSRARPEPEFKNDLQFEPQPPDPQRVRLETEFNEDVSLGDSLSEVYRAAKSLGKVLDSRERKLGEMDAIPLVNMIKEIRWILDRAAAWIPDGSRSDIDEALEQINKDENK